LRACGELAKVLLLYLNSKVKSGCDTGRYGPTLPVVIKKHAGHGLKTRNYADPEA